MHEHGEDKLQQDLSCDGSQHVADPCAVDGGIPLESAKKMNMLHKDTVGRAVRFVGIDMNRSRSGHHAKTPMPDAMASRDY